MLLIDFNWIRATGIMLLIGVPAMALSVFVYCVNDDYYKAKGALWVLVLLVFLFAGFPWGVIF